MDSPVGIILSELLPTFQLSATDVCALLCTCKRAQTANFDRSNFIPYSFAIYPWPLEAIPGRFHIVNGDNTAVVARETLQKTILSGKNFIGFRFTFSKKCTPKMIKQSENRVFNLLDGNIMECGACDFRPNIDIVYVRERFYILLKDKKRIFVGKNKKLTKLLVRVEIREYNVAAKRAKN